MVARPSRRAFLTAGLGTAVAARLTGPRALHELVARAAAAQPAGRDLEAIEHVVILMQENRSFDHYFGVYPNVRGFDDRSNGTSVFEQQGPDGTVLPFHLDLATNQPLCAGNAATPIHDWSPQHQSWNDGKNDRFVSVHSRRKFDGPAQGPLVMGYYTRDDLPFYYSLADAFTIGDAYYCSVLGPTMPNRLYALSATIDPSGDAGGPVVETPGFYNAPQAVGSCRWETMFERLLDDRVSWKFYQPPGTSVGAGQSLALADGFNALLYFEQYLEDPTSELYQRAFLPVWPDEFVADVDNDTLPQVSWVLPPIVDSEHASAAPTNGQALVSTVLSTLTAKPDLWAKTVVFLVYDENGGFFDHVAPPTPPPGTEGEELSKPLPADTAGIAGPIGLGFRVPCLVLSPFSRGGHVNSDVFDHTSLLRFLEARFGTKVPNLTSWRRKTVGDLTSTLHLGRADPTVPPLASLTAPLARLDKECPANDDESALLAPPPAIRVPEHQRIPRQERSG
jgi:phospholipase C